MKFSELISKLHAASQPHMLMHIDIRSDCELMDVNILAPGQSDVQTGTLYFADAGLLTPDTVLPTNLMYYGALPPELASGLTNSAMIDRGEFAALFQSVKELLSYQQSDQQLYTQVLYMLCNGTDLDRVLTKMTDVTGDLFVMIDSTGKLVAKTKNFYVDYPLWMKSIEQGYCSDILMEYIEDRRRKNEYSLSDKPFTLFCEHMQRYLLCTRIVYDNFMMGYVIIVSKTGMFSAAEQQIIPLLSSSAKERIVKSNNGNWIDYRASQLNNVFTDMLTGTQNMPGSPQVTNVAAMTVLGTAADVALVPGLVGAVAEIAAILVIMNLLINRARKRGEHFELHPLDPRYVNTGSKPKLIVALLPMVVLFLLFNIWKLNINICLLCSIALSIALFWPQLRHKDLKAMLNSGAVDSVPMTMTVAAICGFAGVLTNTEAFQSMIDAITSISIAPILICWVVVALMCMLTGGSSTGQLVALPIIAPKLQALGLTASTIHRVSAFAATTLDSMPYSGSILMLLPMCHMKLKEVYPALFVTTVIATTVGTAAVTLMCVLFPGLA